MHWSVAEAYRCKTEGELKSCFGLDILGEGGRGPSCAPKSDFECVTGTSVAEDAPVDGAASAISSVCYVIDMKSEDKIPSQPWRSTE